jgi:hypothetical protein
MQGRLRIVRFVVLCVSCTSVSISASSALSETIEASGHAQISVTIAKQKKDQPGLNQDALQKAESLAVQEAIRHAVLQVAIDPKDVDSQIDTIVPAVADHSASIVLDEQNTTARIDGSSANVDVLVHVNASALRSFLQDNFGVADSIEGMGQFKTYVLSYTVERVDLDRSQPYLTHKEVEENQQGVHSSNFANSSYQASSQSASASLSATASATSRGQALEMANAAGQYRSKFTDPGGSSESASGHVSTSESSNWNNAGSASLDAKGQRGDSSSTKSAASGNAYDDTSHYYHMVVDYSDPTKPAAGTTNAVRAKISGMLTNAGFDVHTLDVSLMDQKFTGEDELVHAALHKIRSNPDVGPNDYVAIALNSFTAVAPNSHEYTAAVTYQLVRVKDGKALLPAENIVGDSGPRPVSDDEGRNWALQAALLDVDARLPNEIRTSMQKLQRDQKREALLSATQYLITLENASSPRAAADIETALATSGFNVERSFNGSSKTIELKVSLNGKTGKDVIHTIDAIDQTADPFDYLDQTSESTRLRAR